LEKIKDFFHDFSDIFFAIIIAGIMFAVLTINLGGWFNEPIHTVLADKSMGTSGDQNNDIIDGQSNNNINLEDEQLNNNMDSEDDKSEIKETKKIIIPSGTYGTGIAKILKENELIDDINDFIQVAENLNLSRRLKSGSFEIPINTTVENMVKIIAGQESI